MTVEFNDLQAKYVSDFESMSTTELQAFLAHLQRDMSAAYRDRRIAKVERKLADNERIRHAREREQAEWIPLALEDKALKERWLALGATWREWHIYSIWEYEGTEFYRWSGGFDRPHVRDEIVRARKADERLVELISGKVVGE